jgi:hypothetical protein
MQSRNPNRVTYKEYKNIKNNNKYVIGNAVDFDNAEAIIQEHEYVSLHSQKG